MGRAIVREPQVFLMDEPLSNLDAKLRVQMRAEIAKLQHELGTTTIYVTHDQVEAMTMGDRVAVMSMGVLQQVDAPAAALRRAGEPVRRELHRHAADEPLRGAVARRAAACSSTLGGAIAAARRRRAAAVRRGIRERAGRNVVVGIRAGGRASRSGDGRTCRPSTPASSSSRRSARA